MAFENYKKTCSLDKPSVVGKVGGRFLRRGEVGDWKNHFSPDMNAKWENWIKDHCELWRIDDSIALKISGLEKI